MVKKRVLALVLAISCAILMSACGVSEKPTVNEVREKTSEDAALQNSDSEENTVLQDSGSEENTAADDASEQDAPDNTAEIKAEETEEEKEETKVPAWNTAVKLTDDLYDFQISIDGIVYQFPMRYSDFEALGWEYNGDNTKTISGGQYVTTQRWRKDGIPVYTVFCNLSTNTAAFSDSMVAGIRIAKKDCEDCGWEILLPGGIQWGVSGTDDIKAAYGDPTSDYDGPNYYEMKYRYDYYREIKLYVYKDSGVLEEIKLENLVELEDG